MSRFKKFLTYVINKIPSRILFRFFFSKINKSNIGVILTLHSITEAKTNLYNPTLNDFIEISEKNLEKLILNFKKLNVNFISLDELYCYLNENKISKTPLVHLSFDDGYHNNFILAYPLLKKHNIPFSVFITSDYIGTNQPFLWWYMIECIILNEVPVSFDKYNYSLIEMDFQTKAKKDIFQEFRTFIVDNLDSDKSYFEYQLIKYIKNIPGCKLPDMLQWDNLNTMLQSGLCELGIHTKSHPRFKSISNDDKINEILICKKAIQDNTGIIPKYFAYPYGSKKDIGSTDGLKEILTNCGIQLAFTTIPDELNKETNKFFVPRVFINNSATVYTLKSRLNGSYQREAPKN